MVLYSQHTLNLTMCVWLGQVYAVHISMEDSSWYQVPFLGISSTLFICLKLGFSVNLKPIDLADELDNEPQGSSGYPSPQLGLHVLTTSVHSNSCSHACAAGFLSHETWPQPTQELICNVKAELPNDLAILLLCALPKGSNSVCKSNMSIPLFIQHLFQQPRNEMA